MLNPIEIHKKEFRRSFRGYNEEEVDSFLDLVLEDYEKLYKDNQVLQKRLEESEGSMSSYRELEEVIKNTLVMAQKNAEELRQNAGKEAAMLVEEAKQQAREITQDAERQAEKIVNEAERKAEERVSEAEAQVKAALAELQELHKQTMIFKARFHSFLKAQLKLLEDESKTWVEEKVVE